jgi:hypothetical protein
MAGLVSAPATSSQQRQNVDARRMGRAPSKIAQLLGLHRPYFDNIGNEVPEQVLDAVLEGRCRRRAARARALHVEVDDAFLVAAEGDVAAVTRHCWAYTRLDQILDGGDGLGVLGVKEFICCGAPDM